MRGILRRAFNISATVIFIIIFIVANHTIALADNVIDSSGKRFNIILVVDASRSLERTDPFGNRHEAIKLMLDRLDMEGHNVGAIVFNHDVRLDTGLSPLNSYEDRMSLYQDIKSMGIGNWTNIGSALLDATNHLTGISEVNGLESVVVLLTDGVTEMPLSTELDKSGKDLKIAIDKAVENGIHIFGIFLNHNNLEPRQELFNIVRASRSNDADPEEPPIEIDEHGVISSLNNQYAEIHDSNDLTSVANQFINWLKGIPLPSMTGTTDEYGDLQYDDIEIPSFGVSELNLTISFRHRPHYILLTDPDNNVLHYGIEPPDTTNIYLNALNSVTTGGNTYWNVKIINPKHGTWQAMVHATPNTQLKYDIVLSNSVDAILSGTRENNSITYASWLSFNGINIPKDGYTGYTIPILQIWNKDSEIPIEYTMKFSENNNQYLYQIDMENEGIYYAKAVYSYGYDERQKLHSHVTELDFQISDPPDLPPKDVFIKAEQQESNVIILMDYDSSVYGYNLYISDNENSLKDVLDNSNAIDDFDNVLLYADIAADHSESESVKQYVLHVSDINKNFENMYDVPLYFSIRKIDLNHQEVQTKYAHLFQMFPYQKNLRREDVKALIFVIGALFLVIALKYSFFNKYKHIVRIGTDGQQNECTLYSGKNLTIVSGDNVVAKNKYILKNSINSFNNKKIAQIQISSRILPFLPLPVLCNRATVTHADEGVEIETKDLDDGMTTFVAQYANERLPLTIWHKNESTSAHKRNMLNITIFVGSFVIGFALLIIGAFL